MRRLAVGCVVERGGKVSKPIYFKAEKTMRKIRILRRKVSFLRRGIDRLYLEMEKTEKGKVKEKLRNLRKEILETLTKEIILTAKVLGADTIVIEELSFKEVPEWKDRTLRWLFSTWFYAKFSGRLREKAKREGIKVVEASPTNTNKECFCGEGVRKEGHYLTCPVHGKYDRDYVASINLGKRYLKLSALEVGSSPETVPSGGNSSPIPVLIRLTAIFAYLELVTCTFLYSLIPEQEMEILDTTVKRC